MSSKNQRNRAILSYMENPNYCQNENCGKIIRVKVVNNKALISALRKRKFCSQSCAATKTNKSKRKYPQFCQKCGIDEIPYTRKYSKRRKNFFCWKCLPKNPNVSNPRNSPVLDYVKGEYFSKCKNWQSASSTIRNLSRKIYKLSDKPKACLVCGYSKHYEVAHKRSVSSFSNETLIREINNIENLVALCRNHHWEYENDQLSPNDRKKIK